MKKLLFIIMMFVASIAQAAKQPEKLTVMLDWSPNPDHAPLIIAKQQGYFKEAGLNVELINSEKIENPAKFVADKKADIGVTYQPEFMKEVDSGMPLVRIGTLMDKPLDCIIALKSSGIHHLKDLKGKRIGTTNAGMTNVMLDVMLKSAGIHENEVQIIPMRKNLTEALINQQVDAIAGVMRNVEVPALERKNQQLVMFFPEDHGVPSYNVSIFVTNSDNRHDPRINKFLAAVKKGVEYLDAHPKSAWLSFAKQYPEANNTVNREIWFATIPYFAEDPSQFDQDEWNKFAAFMQENQLIKTIQPMSRYAVIAHPETVS